LLRKLVDSPWFYFTLAAALLVVTLLLQFERVSVDAPLGTVEELETLREREDLNVVFILIDTLRADRLHVWGYERETSPNLDALAARGIRFARTEAQSSWTKASMVSLWTGMYPERTGVSRFAQAVPEEAVLPAEIFKQAGYRTAGVWRNGWVANNFGFGQGFDLYVKPQKNRPVANVHRNNPSASWLQGTDADATESAIEFMLGAGDQRFFLYVHYMDVHQYLYADTSPDWGSDYSDIYDSAIHWTDRNVGLLVEAVKAQGLLDRTVFVIAVDHGEAFYEHGGEGHARSLYREVLDVPFIIVPPFTLSPGIVVDERVANVDVWPTVLDMIGLPPLPGAEGKSLMPLILEAGGAGDAPQELRDRNIYAQLDRHWGHSSKEPAPMISVTNERYRLIRGGTDPENLELYDRVEDPAEQRNLKSDETEVVEALSAEVEGFLAIPKTQWAEAPEVEIDEMKRAQLRALGYAIPSPQDEREARRKKSKQKAGPDETPEE